CDTVGALRRAGASHGLLSPFAITLPGGRPRLSEGGSGSLLHGRRAGPAENLPEGLGPAVRYLSPGVRAGAAPDARDDVWALGAILCELLTGRSALEAG